MVRKISPLGHAYHEPPYTEEEEMELLSRANGGVVSFNRVSPRPAGLRQKDEIKRR